MRALRECEGRSLNTQGLMETFHKTLSRGAEQMNAIYLYFAGLLVAVAAVLCVALYRYQFSDSALLMEDERDELRYREGL
jgi:hypothetical protein